MAAPVEEWTVGGTALTALMDVERRHGIIIVPLKLSFKLLFVKYFFLLLIKVEFVLQASSSL